MSNLVKRNHLSDKTIRRNHLSNKKDLFEMQLVGIEYASRILQVGHSEKIRMLREAHKTYGVPLSHLAEREDGKDKTETLTKLLEKHRPGLSANRMNLVLLEKGFLIEKEGRSTTNKVEKYKALTDKGRRFGENQFRSKKPHVTFPRYYESTFKELLEVTGL